MEGPAQASIYLCPLVVPHPVLGHLSSLPCSPSMRLPTYNHHVALAPYLSQARLITSQGGHPDCHHPPWL